MQDITKDVGDGIVRLRLDSPSQLVANAWLVRAGDAIVMVDAGFTHTTAQLQAGLAELGMTPHDVTHVLYTHTHADHLGGGIAMQPSWAPEQWVSSFTAPEATTGYYDWHEQFEATTDFLERTLPASPEARRLVEEMRSQPEGPLRSGGDGTLQRVHVARPGDELTLGDRTFRCVDGRGHDPQHVAWLDTRSGSLLSGDVVMRVPTPIMRNMHDELFTWLGTLERWGQLGEVTRLLPGHGMATAMVPEALQRSRQSVERLYTCLVEHLEDGLPVDPVDVQRSFLGDDRSRYAQRIAVCLGTLDSLLFELSRLELTKQLPSRHWVATKGLPTFQSLVQQHRERFGS